LRYGRKQNPKDIQELRELAESPALRVPVKELPQVPLQERVREPQKALPQEREQLQQQLQLQVQPRELQVPPVQPRGLQVH
jgi:hypothetical protein